MLRRFVDQTSESFCILLLLILIYTLYIIVDFFSILRVSHTHTHTHTQKKKKTGQINQWINKDYTDINIITKIF